jgi:hypothetical protein
MPEWVERSQPVSSARLPSDRPLRSSPRRLSLAISGYLGGVDREEDARMLAHGAFSASVLVTIETSVRG